MRTLKLGKYESIAQTHKHETYCLTWIYSAVDIYIVPWSMACEMRYNTGALNCALSHALWWQGAAELS